MLVQFAAFHITIITIQSHSGLKTSNTKSHAGISALWASFAVAETMSVYQLFASLEFNALLTYE